MSESEEKRKLSGLARSIDALFANRSGSAAPGTRTGTPAAAPPPDWDVGARTGEYYADDWEDAAAPALDEPPSLDEEPPPMPTAALGQPAPPEAATADASAADVSDAAGLTAPHAPGVPENFAAAGDAEALDAAPGAEPLEAAGDPGAVDAAVDADTPTPAGRSPAPDPEAFRRAVDAFLAGSPGAAAEVAELATVLRERLSLDPVADAVERLVREAGDPPDSTLIDMAGEIMNPAVASRIVQRIGYERDEALLAEYTLLCRRLGEVMAKAFRGALTGATEREARRTYYDMMIAMSDSCRPIIEEMVEDENTLLVRSGVAILGEIGGDRSVELVTSALAHPDARVRREALLALAALGDEESGALVTGFFEDPDRDVRIAAATAAGELRIDRALRPLLAQLEAEGDGDGAIPFIDALGKLGDPGAVPAIEKHAVKTLFSKPRNEVRVAAYRALHRIGTPHARELVQAALDAKEPGIWVAVRQLVDSEREP